VHAVRHGLSNARIAVRRGISRDAVKFHVRNAVAKLGLRSRAELQRWPGVPKDSAVHRRVSNKEIAMATQSLRLGAVGQIARTVRDIDEAAAWYGEVLRLQHLYTFGKLAFFDLGGTRLLLSAESGAVSPESILYLRVDDIGAAHAELASRGVEFKGAPHLIHRHADGTEEWMAFFTDPEGRLLALMSQVRPNGP
jgi:predicted enzyme related to lactoylglutathione lyase